MAYYESLSDCEIFEAHTLSHRFNREKHSNYDSREDFERSILVSMAALKSDADITK